MSDMNFYDKKVAFLFVKAVYEAFSVKTEWVRGIVSCKKATMSNFRLLFPVNMHHALIIP
jgi:hypothetical protein